MGHKILGKSINRVSANYFSWWILGLPALFQGLLFQFKWHLIWDTFLAQLQDKGGDSLMEYATPLHTNLVQNTCHPSFNSISAATHLCSLVEGGDYVPKKLLAPDRWSISVEKKKNQGNGKTIPSAEAHWSGYLTGYSWQTHIIHPFHKLYFWNLGI